MRIILLSICFCFAMLPALAQNQGGNNQGQNNNNQGGGGRHGAPAPLIGAGIPVMLVAGGVWLGRKLLKRKR